MKNSTIPLKKGEEGDSITFWVRMVKDEHGKYVHYDEIKDIYNDFVEKIKDLEDINATLRNSLRISQTLRLQNEPYAGDQ